MGDRQVFRVIPRYCVFFCLLRLGLSLPHTPPCHLKSLLPMITKAKDNFTFFLAPTSSNYPALSPASFSHLRYQWLQWEWIIFARVQPLLEMSKLLGVNSNFSTNTTNNSRPNQEALQNLEISLSRIESPHLEFSAAKSCLQHSLAAPSSLITPQELSFTVASLSINDTALQLVVYCPGLGCRETQHLQPGPQETVK